MAENTRERLGTANLLLARRGNLNLNPLRFENAALELVRRAEISLWATIPIPRVGAPTTDTAGPAFGSASVPCGNSRKLCATNGKQQ